MLYRENDWVYVITQLGQEGFLPFICLNQSNNITDSKNGKEQNRKEWSADDGSDSQIEGKTGDNAQMSAVLQSAHVIPSTVSNPLPKPARMLNVPDLVSTDTHVQYMSQHKQQPQTQPVSFNSRTRRGSSKSVNSDSVTEVKTYIKEPCGKCLVVFEFHVEDENDVRVDKGEVVTALNKDDPQWTWVRKLSGQEGFVPSSFMCPLPHDLTTNTSSKFSV